MSSSVEEILAEARELPLDDQKQLNARLAEDIARAEAARADNQANHLSGEQVEIEDALDALAEGSERLPVLSEAAFTREYIYQERY
jgi:hypothetical protein